MKQTGKCPKCGSSGIVADVKTIDRGPSLSQFDMSIATYRNPEALVFKEKQETTVSAWVCEACGYVEFYADQPKAIRLRDLKCCLALQGSC